MQGARKDHPFSVEASQAKKSSVSTRIVAYDAAASGAQDTEPRSIGVCARNVCDYFTSTDQVDCLMNLLSLCLLYALDIKENTRNDGQLVETSGGEFRDGPCVIE
ncbi:unnamed protein product [Phytophthora fragariaefolia]|uniref:Unnamed protein product n=1 Tax=Phytophthora fragariaefolia TaxID=1490495 RepID=A0A9W6U9H6_9STRA|nr:unnamed protein product [Phytophthora fragariaefolia]